MERIDKFLEENADRFLEELMDYLRIASVSADSRHRSDMQRAAKFTRDQLVQAGLDAEVVPTDGHPIVLGRSRREPDRPTVLIYGHYDVQPPEPLDEWQTPPFEPSLRDGYVYARGATDDKGQLLTHIKSVEAWTRTHGDLPVNVLFLIEGEEEVGSDNLERFLSDHCEELASDVAVISDTMQFGPDQPAITYGLRGIIACEVRLTGPNRDLHSGSFGGAVTNPATALARLLAALHDDQGRVQIPGFYDDVRPLTEQERAEWARLPFDPAAFFADLGVTDGWGEAGYSPLERCWARPTCDVNGLVSGHTGEGPKTIVPSTAVAKISCRLVPDQNPSALLKALEQFLRARLLPGLTMEIVPHHGGQPVLFDPNSPAMHAARRAIERAFGVAPVMIREGGSIPVVASFREILGVDTLLLGWGQNTDNLHSPNERFRLIDFRRGTRASAYLWPELRDALGKG
ncbi:MAG: dipeptidase [Planctomycetes bacterium]|nr:dipeptidase [Planctomycetota bacterium]